MGTLSEMKELLGERVVVTLDENDSRAISSGLFLRISDDGEAVILQDDFTVHYCWPALHVRKIHEQ